jgi:hypothetical protein
MAVLLGITAVLLRVMGAHLVLEVIRARGMVSFLEDEEDEAPRRRRALRWRCETLRHRPSPLN